MPSLLEALERKYGQSMTHRQTEDLPVAIFVPKRPPRLSVPTLLVLNDCDIDCGGDDELLEDKCAGVEELDLAKNKLTKWGEVLGILQHMPQVKFVNLSFNRLSEQIDALNKLQGSNGACWQYLRNLVLNSTRIEWSSVQSLLKLLPVLEELHLSLNEYAHVDLEPKTHAKHNEQTKSELCESERVLNSNDNDNPSSADTNDNCRLQNDSDSSNNLTARRRDIISHPELKKLHFSGNQISEWKEVCKLGRAFPNLETLLLNECPLTTLSMGDETDERRNKNSADGANGKRKLSHECFKKLRFLNLNNTGLATWDEVDRLAKFPSLLSLRIQGWPLWERCEATEHERRQLLVARLPGVSTLNGGGTLSADEREDAERAFIRYYMEKPEADRPDRYWELVAIHGKLDPLVTVDLRPEKRVKVTFSCGPTSEVRTVDVYRTVLDLKSRLERLAGIPAAKMRLFYVDQDLRDLQGPEEMKYPHKQLYSYNIQSGDEIIIDSKH